MNRLLHVIAIAVLLSLEMGSVESAATDKVLLVSNRDGNAQIYLMNADGSAQQALTKGPAENVEPAWSPDGERIAFTSYRDGNAEIYLMNADGSEQTRLTHDSFSDTAAAWLSEGELVFRSNRDRWTNFYRMDVDGSNLKQLTNSELDKGEPVLSPDGELIAFASYGGSSKSEIFVMSATGGEPKNLTGGLSKNKKYAPAWSPDSHRLLYVEAKDSSLNICSIDSDGSNVVKITDNQYTNANPIWSPDGKRIAFVSSREGSRIDMARGDIYIMNADGSDAINVTRNNDEDNYPAWSADGSAIFFVSLRDGNAQIYQVQLDSLQQQRITHNAGYDMRIIPRARSNAQGFF